MMNARLHPLRPAVITHGRRRHVQMAASAPATDGVDMEVSGLKHLSPEARERATAKKINPFEKVKNKKCGSRMWTEVHELSALLREGKSSLEDLDLDDVDVRLKWAGLFHRKKRTPGKFMMRLKVPNGELNSKQLRMLADCIRPYGTDGCADITTRANIQLRGITLDDSSDIIRRLEANGLTSFMSGMDNVRNLTGSPIAGLDPHELVDVRPLLTEMQDLITNHGKGREDLTNLPRKINICVSPTRDDFPHTHINDLGFQAVRTASGEVVFNVEVGGYFSIKRNVMSIPLGCSITKEQVVPFAEAVMKVFRDNGARGDRQKTRLMWLVEEIGEQRFTELVAEAMGGASFGPHVNPGYDDTWERRDVLGVHAQKQEGLSWVGACVPAGRLQTADFEALADVADKYSGGEVRITCEENVIFPNVPNDSVPAMLKEPLFQRFKVDAGNLTRAMVSCTGSQFCGFGLVETKNRAIAVAEQLEKELHIPKPVRMHWTGCPNSCGQAQVGDIGLMGGPAKLDGKAVEGVRVFAGGKIGEGAVLAEQIEKGVPADPEHLVPYLKELLIKDYGCTPIS